MTAVTRGATFAHTVTLTTPSGAALDLSGWDAWAILREANKSNLPVVVLLKSGGRVAISSGTVEFTLTAADTGQIETDNCLLDYFIEDDFGTIVRSGTISLALTGAIVPPSSGPYTPATPADWLTVPTTVPGALDSLADASPTIFYVDPIAGDDAKSGSEKAPLQTLQEACNRYLASGVSATIRIVNDVPNTDTLHLDTGLAIGASAPKLVIESAVLERRYLLCDIYIHGTKSITLALNRIYHSTQSFVVGGPNLVVIGEGSAQFSVIFDGCEIERTELNGEGIVFTALQRVSFRNTTLRSGLVSDIVFTDVKFLEFHDSWIDPFSLLSFNNMWFVRTNTGISKIIMMSAAIPEAGVISDGVIPVFWYRNFSQKNPEFLVSGGGQIRIGIANDIVFSANAPAVSLTAGVTMELMNCKSLSPIDIQSGATIETSHCRLPAVANAGAWTDYGSTVSSVSGDGTTTYNGTTIATIPTITAATRTQLRTDRALNFDATSNSIAYNLLSLASTPLDHKISLLRKPGGGANTVTITPNGAETIDGLASVTLVEYQHTALVNKGTFWSAQ